ncbi:unnamed protein product, partial [Prorocentrum cordatum]
AVVACAAPRRSTARVSVRGSPAAARAPAARAADGGRSAWSRGPHGRKTRWRAAPPVRQQRGHEHGTTTTRWRGGGGGGGGGGGERGREGRPDGAVRECSAVTGCRCSHVSFLLAATHAVRIEEIEDAGALPHRRQGGVGGDTGRGGAGVRKRRIME